MVETSRPNSKDIAIPWKIGSVRIMAAPTMVDTAVIKMGRVLAMAAEITASYSDMPLLSCSKEKYLVARHPLGAKSVTLRPFQPPDTSQPRRELLRYDHSGKEM
jgi:hypothetical protein